MKLVWSKKAKERYRNLLSTWRSKGERPSYVPESVWAAWQPHWQTEEFRAKSHQCSRNRLSETGGAGAGPSRHTGGSLSHWEHARRLVCIFYNFNIVNYVLQ